MVNITAVPPHRLNTYHFNGNMTGFEFTNEDLQARGDIYQVGVIPFKGNNELNQTLTNLVKSVDSVSKINVILLNEPHCTGYGFFVSESASQDFKVTPM